MEKQFIIDKDIEIDGHKIYRVRKLEEDDDTTIKVNYNDEDYIKLSNWVTEYFQKQIAKSKNSNRIYKSQYNRRWF